MRTALEALTWRMGVLLATLLAPTAFAAGDAEVAGPHIAECRVGLDGTLKVGHWTPVWVDVAGEGIPGSHIELIAVDSDGVEVAVQAKPAALGTALLYTRLGRLGSGLHVRLVAEDGRVLDRAELMPATSTDGGQFTTLQSTGTLVLQIGPGDLGLAGVLADPGAADSAAVGAAVQIVDVESLPTDWFGYDAADVVVLSTGDLAFCERLAADSERFEALKKWLQLGGRMLICVGRNAPELLAGEAPFAEFVPGRFTELVRLPQTQTIETFAASRDALSRSGAQQSIPLPLLADITGHVELFGRANDLPILVRSAHGFGELAFLGIDPTDEPFADWTGRTGLLRAVLRPYLPEVNAASTKQKLVSLGYDDLAGALRQRLGSSFAGVSVLGFPLVAGLIIGYLLWLGPLDYLFVERVAQRAWVAWLTLPVIVLATSFGAAHLATRSKAAGGPQLNGAELVDVDMATGLVRGTCWSTLYSPEAERFSVMLSPRLPDGEEAEHAETLVSWLGLPGRGLGGMHAGGDPIDVAGVGYQALHQWSELAGVPLLTAATKSLVAQWVVDADASQSAQITAQLSLNDEGLLVGSIANNTLSKLEDVCLMSGQSGYRLGDLAPGEQLAIGPALSPLRTRAILARRVRRAQAGEQETFLPDRATADQLLNVMMFYQAFGGEG
ncbi:MAG: hypothetical protein AB7I57_21070, partial [Pirellulales bacterium]